MNKTSNKVRFSFYRDYQRYTGGHQKFRDYLEHTACLSNAECHLYSNNRCSIMPGLFSDVPNVLHNNVYEPEKADVVFLAGMDWKAYLPKRVEGQRVINLIQHVRHGDKNHPLFKFLEHEALRLCVSEQVRQAILPYANGECVTIKMGHSIPSINVRKDLDLYVLGKKNPNFATAIVKWAETKKINVKADIGLVTRNSVYENFARARISLVLPNATEGFFLPGIEAMALSERVIVPDCVGNRGYCKKHMNITLCDYEESACIIAIERAMKRLNSPVHAFEKFRGEREALSYAIDAEREKYQRLLIDKNLI